MEIDDGVKGKVSVVGGNRNLGGKVERELFEGMWIGEGVKERNEDV